MRFVVLGDFIVGSTLNKRAGSNTSRVIVGDQELVRLAVDFMSREAFARMEVNPRPKPRPYEVWLEDEAAGVPEISIACDGTVWRCKP